eukprot:CAMPEP_0171470284 /NCGR_PEP_ID=MMETSP0946-20130122/74_1 /TAXON_ID=109269 /ORGANISM="Vaucheria litorea, Strain CCMP2940" /LENGTH=966 /DNA_ID=CAMNT_0011999667 /DNA_START=79 /DNA_END=2979 /DNA_ORIENTATION=+
MASKLVSLISFFVFGVESSILSYLETSSNFNLTLSCIYTSNGTYLEDLDESGAILTFFAIPDDIIARRSQKGQKICQTSSQSNEFLAYLCSPTDGAYPYIGKKFSTLSGFSAVYYGIPITKDVPKDTYFPVQYINGANVTEIVEVDKTHKVYVLDSIIEPPKGTMWDILGIHEGFSKLFALINESLSLELKSLLSDPSKQLTFFAPDDSAYGDMHQISQEANGSFETLYNFHILEDGSYPRSLNGAHFLQQLFPTFEQNSLTKDIYKNFYSTTEQNFEIKSKAIPPIQFTKKGGLVNVQGGSILESNIPAINGVIHRISKVLEPPNSVFETAANKSNEFINSILAVNQTFDDFKQIIAIGQGFVEKILANENDSITLFMPTDDAISEAISLGNLPNRPFNETISQNEAFSIVSYHTFASQNGPFLFDPSKNLPFNSNFNNETFVGSLFEGTTNETMPVWVYRKGSDLNQVSYSEEVFLNNARVFQCSDGYFGNFCRSTLISAKSSNLYALNGPKLCALHAIDKLLVPPIDSKDMKSLIGSMKEISTFSKILEQIGTDFSSENEPFTIFAPTNYALEQANASYPNFFSDSDRILEIVNYHIITGKMLFSRYFTEEQYFQTLAANGSAPIRISANSKDSDELKVYVNGFEMILSDLLATNGVVNVINETLIPNLEQISVGFGYVEIIDRYRTSKIAEMLGSEGNSTLFVPRKKTFSNGNGTHALLYNFLPNQTICLECGKQFHTNLSGSANLVLYETSEAKSNPFFTTISGIYANEAEFVDFKPINAINGQIWVLDRPIKSVELNIWEKLSEISHTRIFFGMVSSCPNVVQLMKGEGSGFYTIFVPSDKAFEAIGQKRTHKLARSKQLCNLIEFHVASDWLTTPILANATASDRSKISGSSFCGGITVPTVLRGETIDFQVGKGSLVFVGTSDWPFSASLVESDIVCTNGVIHVISSILTFKDYVSAV